METRTVEQVESWKSRRFTDGYAGLRELSDGEFSGAVRAGGAWLFMLNGRAIGVHEGSLDDFEDADGTAYAAPHPSLPLLFSMKAQGGDTRAKYYTNDTPLSEADSTLTDGGFTGYVELSENVLSGDYYVAYYGGRSMSVAFVGASEQVISGDDAFERAADEVGIYEVRDVDLEVIDLPEPEGADDDESADPAGAGTDANADASGAVGSVDSPATDSPATDSPTEPNDESVDRPGRSTADETPGGAGTGPTPGVTEVEPTDAEPTDTEPTDAETPASDGNTDPAGTAESNRSPTDANADAGTDADTDSRTPSSHETDSARPGATTTAETVTESPPDAAVTEETTTAETAAETTPEAVTETDAASDRSDAAGEQATDDEAMFDEEEEWRGATTIPSLDPDRTEDSTPSESRASDRGSASASAERAERPTGQSHSSAGGAAESSPKSASRSSGQSRPDDRSQAANRTESRSPAAEAPASGESSTGKASEEANAQVKRLRSQLEQRGQQVERLESRLSKAQSERDELKRERDALRQEVERLEARLESAAAAGDAGGTGASRRLDRAQAFDGTNLFVRYRSKGDATLDEAAAGDAAAEDVNANLQLEHHTQFEADDVAVEGTPFAEFLAESFEYRFASWVVEDLLYEIRDTGHRGRLRDLYEAIPKIDRVDLHGSVSAGGDDEDTRQEAFDVIMRDRMGNPLFVADLNGSRDPTTGEMMGSLVDAATGVAEAHDELAGAFQVTESFFEPEALETTESATSGGLLSREKRESYVKLSRKRGYHLCLVESRSGGFHLNVPEL